MRTVILGQTPPEIEALIESRRRTARGLSVTTGINIGVADDFRIPDLTLVSDRSDELWVATAELVVEFLSPHDESRAKLPFYAAHGVREAVIVDPVARTIEWFRSDGTAFAPVEHSELLGVAAAVLAGQIEWPPVDTSD